MLIAIGVGLLSLGISLWQLSVPEFLAPYDTGVYMAATIHLVSGILPYRDFVFVQPPGVLLILSPIGLISRVFGAHDGLIAGRILTGVVTALNASLLAWLVRGRGRCAMLIAGGGLALIPVSLFVSSEVKLEPYCAFFVLLGALVAFSGHTRTTPSSRRTLIIAGVLFGLAALMKLWAIFPFVALIIALIPQLRRRVAIPLISAGSTFLMVSLPFFLSAPRNFIAEVIVDQLERKGTLVNSLGDLWRLVYMTGFGSTNLHPDTREALIGFIAFAILVAFAYRLRPRPDSVEVFLLLSAVLTMAGLTLAPEFYNYYGYFLAPFVMGVLGISLARLAAPLRNIAIRLELSKVFLRLISFLSAAISIIFVIALTLYITTFYTTYAWAFGMYGPYLNPIDKAIPSGSCVVYDEVIMGIFENRFSSTNPHCPNLVDPTGMWMGWGYDARTTPLAFAAQWETYFKEAQYVVLTSPTTSNIPWDLKLTAWFHLHYREVYSRNYVHIYKHDRS
ncbi:MAG: hypothetical protein WCA31_09095 [Acidimicrobiales bacterium]